MKKSVRKIIILMAVAVCIAMLCSVLFMAAAAGHDCTHEDCEICCQIAVCMQMLKSFALVFVLLAIAMAARSGAVWAAFRELPCFVQPTLITHKVKLSN